MSLRLAFARTDCYPYDTLCTYEVNQLRFQGLYMVDSTGLEPVTPCTSTKRVRRVKPVPVTKSPAGSS